MPPKKKKKGSAKKGKKKGAKPEVDLAKQKAENEINLKAARERSECIAGIQWVERFRIWFQQNRSNVFDTLRLCDQDSDGVLSTDEFSAGLLKAKAPLDSNEMETLAVSIDFKDDKRIEYCIPAHTLRCYGGGLQELVDKALERVMINHRQDLAEINEAHANALKGIYGGTSKEDGSRPETANIDAADGADKNDEDDGDDGDDKEDDKDDDKDEEKDDENDDDDA